MAEGWSKLAACANRSVEDLDPDEHRAHIELFFETYESDKEMAKQVDQMCLSCPVTRLCYEYGVKSKVEGVWGGVYLRSSGKIDPGRNAHKTKRDWERWSERVGD